MPAGVAITFSDDSSPATIPNNVRTGQPNNPNMPDNMNGDMMGGNMPTDTTAPTVTTIAGTVGTGDNSNTISWTVTFSERVTGIEQAHFTLSPSGGMFGTVPTDTGEGTTITFTTTHTDMNDGDITLMFDADGGTAQVQDLSTTPNSATADFTLPMAMAVNIDVPPTVNYLANLPSTATNLENSFSSGTRQVRLQGNNVTLNGVTYAFNSPNENISTNNRLIIPVSNQGTNVGYTAFLVGTDVSSTSGTSFTEAYIYRRLNPVRATQMPTGMVSYTGEYTLLRRPPGSSATLEMAVINGTVAAMINFDATSNHVTGTLSGEAGDGSAINDAATLTFGITPNSGRLFLSGSIADNSNNNSNLDGISLSMTGEFAGTNADEFVVGGSSFADNTDSTDGIVDGSREVIGIIATRQP